MGVVGRAGRLVGRQDELDMLRRTVAEARAGDLRVLLIEGEAGIGKTRLALELLEEMQLAGDLVLSGHGIDLTGGELVWGVAAELLRDVVRQVGSGPVRDLLGEHARHLGALDPDLVDRGDTSTVTWDRVAGFGAFHTLVLQLARDRLVCVYVDDLQWVDTSSLDLLRFLARVTIGAPLVIVCTIRSAVHETDPIAQHLSDLSRAVGSRSIRLAGLSPTEILEQIEQMSQGRPDHAVVERIQALSDGVPLYVEELLAAGGDLPISHRVDLAGRLTDLQPHARRLVEAVAVARGHASMSLVGRVCGLDPVAAEDAGREAVRCGVLDIASGVLEIHHALLRDAVLATLSARQLREWHVRWAEAVEQSLSDLPEPMVLHARALHWSGAQVPAKALPAAVRAGRSATQLAGTTEAYVWFRSALRMWDEVEEPSALTGMTRDELLVETTQSYSFASKWDELVQLCDEEVAHCPPEAWVRLLFVRLRRVEAIQRATGTRPHFCDPDEAERLVEALIAEPADEMVIRALLWLALQGKDVRDRVFDRAHQAVEVRAKALGAERVYSASLASRTVRAMERGDIEEALEAARRAVPADPRASVRGSSVGDLMWCHLALGDVAEALAIGDAITGGLSARAAAVLWRDVVANLVTGLSLAGEWDKALAHMTALLEVHPHGWIAGDVHAGMAEIAAARGQLDLAESHIAAARELLPPVGDPTGEFVFTVLPVLASAHLQLLKGDGDAAVSLLTPVLTAQDAPADSETLYRGLLTAARALAALTPAQLPRHAATVERAAATLHRYGSVGRAWSLEVAGRIADVRGAPDPEAWADVVAAWRDVGFPYHRSFAQLAHARALLATGDRADARPSLVEAWETATQLGAVPLADRIRACAAAGRLSLDGARRAETPVELGVLTARERDVLGLVAVGRTNAQIASELFISPKTASVHVSRIIAKLGVANRTEASAYAHLHGMT